MSIISVLLFSTAMTTALVAGLLYAYSCSVNPGLGALPNREYLLAMQSVNKEILNPLFFASFMGSLVLLPCSAWALYKHHASLGALILVCAFLLYLAGVFAVTMAGNVPLNDALASFNLHTANQQELAGQRQMFEEPWNRYHTIRTIASVITLAVVMLVCLYHTKGATG